MQPEFRSVRGHVVEETTALQDIQQGPFGRFRQLKRTALLAREGSGRFEQLHKAQIDLCFRVDFQSRRTIIT